MADDLDIEARLDREEQERKMAEMTDQEWRAFVDNLDRQYETPQRSAWYRQTQAEHEMDLKSPQRFPLTGDGLVTERIIATGPYNGPDIGAELALARYRDYQHAEKIMPTQHDEEKLQNWLQALLNKAPEQKRDAQLLLTETRQQEIEEQTRQRSLSI